MKRTITQSAPPYTRESLPQVAGSWITRLAHDFTCARTRGQLFKRGGSERKLGRRSSYYAWHKSQQMLESAPLAPLIGFLRLLKYLQSNIFGGFIGFTKDRSDGLGKRGE